MQQSKYVVWSVTLIFWGFLEALSPEGIPAPNYNCPEPNGRFPDPEQCDKYYICKKGEAEEILCPEGLLFDNSIPNREKCVLPHNVDCGAREFVQDRAPGSDPRCEKANGVFNHDDPRVCNKYLNCDKGVAFEMPCPDPLYFDVEIGGCVRQENLSEYAKRCSEENDYLEIDGFKCPGGDTIGPQGLLQQHPVYPHPNDCQFYFTCYFGKVRIFNIKTRFHYSPTKIVQSLICTLLYHFSTKF